jgi:hypothetical protein
VNRIEAILKARAVVLAEIAERQAELTYLEGRLRAAVSDTPVSASGPTYCTACGADVSTELLFSLHFTVPDFHYPNLGECQAISQ